MPCSSALYASSYDPKYEAYKYYLKGVLALKGGLVEDAKKDYEKAASLDPDALAVQKDLIYLYWQAGNNEKAFKTADKIEAMDGNTPQTNIFLATFYLVANDAAKAKKYWEKTLELDPENETATVYLAAYHYSDNHLDESAQYWNKFLKQQPDSAAGYFQLAMVQEKLGKLEEALKSYDRVIELKPEAKEAYLSKARIYENTGDFESAIKVYEEYVNVFPDNLYVLMYLGKCYYETKNYGSAEEAFLKAKKGLPNDVTASYWLGLIYEKTGRLDKAAAEFEELSSKEGGSGVLARLGYYYSLLKKYEKAEKKLAKALENDPANTDLRYLYALNYLDWKKYDKAVDNLKKFIEAKPDFTDAYFFLGSAYEKAGNFEEAEKAFYKTLELDPNHARAMNYLGYMYADRNVKLDEAQKLLDKAVQLEPNNGAYLDSLGWLYYRQGRYEEAEKTLLAAIKSSSDPLIYEHLGDACVENSKIGDAWVAYALSYDMGFGANKDVRKKLLMVQEKLDKNDFYLKMLQRSENNYRRLPSFKTGYTASVGSALYKVKTYVPFSYARGNGVKIEIPGRFALGEAAVYIKNGNIEFSPKALEGQLPAEVCGILDFASVVFGGDFYSRFITAKVTRKGNKIIYSQPGGEELTLDADTALILKISKDGKEAEPVKYTEFFMSKLPSKIKASSKNPKFKGIFEANTFSLLNGNDFIRNSGEQSSVQQSPRRPADLNPAEKDEKK